MDTETRSTLSSIVQDRYVPRYMSHSKMIYLDFPLKILLYLCLYKYSNIRENM